jgi:hypothetical protein
MGLLQLPSGKPHSDQYGYRHFPQKCDWRFDSLQSRAL